MGVIKTPDQKIHLMLIAEVKYHNQANKHTDATITRQVALLIEQVQLKLAIKGYGVELFRFEPYSVRSGNIVLW